MFAKLALTVVGVVAGVGIWRLIQGSQILSTLPVWVRLYVAFFVSVFVAAVVSTFLVGRVADNLAVGMILGYAFVEIVRYDTPATRDAWRRIRRRFIDADGMHARE